MTTETIPATYQSPVILDGLEERPVVVSVVSGVKLRVDDIVRVWSEAGSEIALVVSVGDEGATLHRGFFSGSEPVAHRGPTTMELIGAYSNRPPTS